MKTKNTQNYQGDVSLIRCEEVNKASEKIKFSPLPKEGVIVAYGEVTGHTHRVVKEREDVSVEFGEDVNGFYFKVAGGNAIIKHQEHGIQILTPGITFVGKQYEFDEIVERRVQD